MALLRALAVALTPSAVALRSRLADPEESLTPLRQELENIGDVYLTNVTIGDQHLKAAFDTTASVDMLVFGVDCGTCAFSGKYDQESSALFKKGAVTKSVSYGHGMCTATDGYDTVAVEGLAPRNQSMWVASDCLVKNLALAGDTFNAVISPGSLVNTFSICLGSEPLSPGYIIWNDKTRKGQPGVTQLPLSGKAMVNTTGIRLTKTPRVHHKEIGCQNGCDVVMDIGSNLIGLPTEVFHKFPGANRVVDCQDLAKFPMLEITLGGHKFELPPTSYLFPGNDMPEGNAKVAEFMQLPAQGLRFPKNCRALVKDNGPGKTVTLGTPWFRKFYTTFSATENSLFFSEASDTCEPVSN